MNEDTVPVEDENATVDNGNPEPAKVSFRVCWGKTSDRATGAILVLSQTDDKADPETPFAVDEDGDLDIALEDGEWSCTAIHPDGRQLRPRLLKIPNDLPEAGEKIELRLISLTREINQTWGRWTFAILIALLAALAWAWVETHRLHPDPGLPSRASAMLDAAAQLRADLAATDDPRKNESLPASITALGAHLDSSRLEGDLKKKLDETAKSKARMDLLLLTNAEKVMLELQQLEVDLGEAGPVSERPGADGNRDDQETPLTETIALVTSATSDIGSGAAPAESEALAELVDNLATLRAEGSNSEDFRQKLNGFEQKFRAWLADDAEIGNEALNGLLAEEITAFERTLPDLAASELEASDGTVRSTLWSKPPGLYLEILFWATAGILVQLIITIAGYLRWNTFIKNGIYLHMALLITVPLLTLVFVQIISMGRLTADDSTVVLNLSDPRIVAGAAFLIALVPWGLWDRIRGASRKILGDNSDGN